MSTTDDREKLVYQQGQELERAKIAAFLAGEALKLSKRGDANGAQALLDASKSVRDNSYEG